MPVTICRHGNWLFVFSQKLKSAAEMERATQDCVPLHPNFAQKLCPVTKVICTAERRQREKKKQRILTKKKAILLKMKFKLQINITIMRKCRTIQFTVATYNTNSPFEVEVNRSTIIVCGVKQDVFVQYVHEKQTSGDSV